MRSMLPDSVDAVVTDAPYGLEFMGKDWDFGVPGAIYWEEALRVAKPGAHLLCFGGSRTFHRLACNIEDAGWEIRDCLMWLSSGFPKGTNMEKAVAKHDAEEAKKWHGWNTQLKPAFEPVIMARKPPRGTTVSNVMAYGTGALNVEACKVGDEVISYGPKKAEDCHAFEPKMGKHTIRRSGFEGSTHQGRWPANVIIDEGVSAMIDEQAGRPVARFYYCYKASIDERDEGLEDGNIHPTVKPVALMRYLCRLVTPPNGIVLDPFCGSGSTLVAAQEEGFHYIGIDIKEEYIKTAEKRLTARAKPEPEPPKETAQASLERWFE
jgi:site-specific DNA-methyltransferase (adenine-specific)